VTAPPWTFRRFIRVSREYTRPMPWWKFYPAAIRRWPRFNAQQRRDVAELTAAEGK
jgi:hypothetical protein